MSELPKGWIETKLENVVEILDSKRKPVSSDERLNRISGKKEYELYPYFGATGRAGFIDDYLFDEELVALGEDGVPFFDPMKSKAYMLYGKTWVNNHAHVLKGINGCLLNKFLCFYLNKFDYLGYVNGGTRLKLTQANMCKIPLTLPPIIEQTRIVEKLDEVLAQVDTIKARLDGIPAILKRFRQSVLAAAVSGRLTEEWRGNTEFFTESEKLLNIIVNASVGLVRSSQEQSLDSKGKTPYLKMNNIDNFWGVSDSRMVYVDVNAQELEKYSLQQGDWLFNTRNSIDLVGKSCVWKKNYSVVYNNNILRVKCGERIHEDYLEIFFKSPFGMKSLNKIKSGTTNVAAIYQKQLMQVEIDFPSFKEQKEIVRLVDQYFAFADTIEAQVKKAQARVDNLTQSILAKAFRGELVAQDPDDEPAEKLLERIAQARKEAEELAKAAKKVAKTK